MASNNKNPRTPVVTPSGRNARYMTGMSVIGYRPQDGYPSTIADLPRSGKTSKGGGPSQHTSLGLGSKPGPMARSAMKRKGR